MSESRCPRDISKEFATWINTGVMIWYMKIHDTTDWARGTLKPEQCRLYCRAAARVLGFTTSNLLDRIYRQHPELTPEVFRLGQEDAGASELMHADAVTMNVSEFSEDVLELGAAVEMNLRDILSMAKLCCAPEAYSSLKRDVGEILEQVDHWISFMLTRQYEDKG